VQAHIQYDYDMNSLYIHRLQHANFYRATLCKMQHNCKLTMSVTFVDCVKMVERIELVLERRLPSTLAYKELGT